MSILIERTLTSGYENKEYQTKEAIHVLNTEIENKRSIWIDNTLFGGEVIREEDISNCSKVCITNRLIGG